MVVIHSPEQRIKLPSSPHSLLLRTDDGAYRGVKVKLPHTTQRSVKLQNSYLCPPGLAVFPTKKPTQV